MLCIYVKRHELRIAGVEYPGKLLIMGQVKNNEANVLQNGPEEVTFQAVISEVHCFAFYLHVHVHVYHKISKKAECIFHPLWNLIKGMV